LLLARVALLPSFAAPCGTNAQDRQDVPFIPSQALAAACSDDADDAGTRSADLPGTWRVPITELPLPDGSATAFIRRTVVFTEDGESLTVEAHANPEASTPLFAYAPSGPYTVNGAAPGIDGVLSVDLVNDRSEVTVFVDAPDLWRAIGLESCPLQIGVAVEIAG